MNNNNYMLFKKCYEFVFFIALVLYTVFINNSLFYYDEPYYLYNIELLNKFGLSSRFLEEMNGPAGPLHGIVFWILHPITGNNVIYVRLVNLTFLLLVIQLAKKIYFNIYNVKMFNARWAIGLMSIPMVYVCGGLALTEMLSLLMLTISLYFLFFSCPGPFNYNWLLSGFFLSLAISGRQPYLLLAAPYLFWYFIKVKGKMKGFGLVSFLFSIVMVPFLLFYQWKGIAPHTGGDIANAKLIDFPFLLLGLGYGFLTLLFVDRHLIIKIKRKHWSLMLVGFVSCFLICYLLKFKQPLMMTVASKIIPASLFNLYGIAVASVLLMAALIFTVSVINGIIANLKNPERMLLYICLLLIILSCGKISHQFSSRYVFQGAIFFILLGNSEKMDNKQLILSCLGAIIGFVSLISYYQ